MAMTTVQRRVALASAIAVLLLIYAATPPLCVRAWLGSGIAVPICPDGRVHQTVGLWAEGLGRKVTGQVHVAAYGVYTEGPADSAGRVPVRRFDAELALIGPDGKEYPLEPLKGWETRDDHQQTAQVILPELPDGDYRLRATVDSPIEKSSHELTLPLYAAAKVHVITDRPLYEPGNTVRFRSVVLRSKDLAPLEGRPGRWLVTDPSGEVFLEEDAPAGPWGVASGSFPLDRAATPGAWTVRWQSGNAEDVASFRVEPFTLPRFRVEAAASQPFYGAGDRPVVRGEVRYSSGAPVAGATLEVSWTSSGEWPPPPDWMETRLPRRATTQPNGRFTLELPQVPTDLRRTSVLHAAISATDPAGDRVEGAASVLLAEDPIQVSAVTELGDGLVGGFNNRVYLRATTSGGRVLAKTELLVKRAWDPKDKGTRATTDEDGVASLQLDPGPPVNVRVPAMPVRVVIRKPSVSMEQLRDLLGGEEGEETSALADQLALERLQGSLLRCTQWVVETASTEVGFRVTAGGSVSEVTSDGSPVGRCVAEVLQGRALSAGRERVYAASFTLDDGGAPRLELGLNGVRGIQPAVQAALGNAALAARSCLPAGMTSQRLPRALGWRTRADGDELSVWWIPDTAGAASFPGEVLGCIQARMSQIRLAPAGPGPAVDVDEGEESGEARRDNIGVATLDVIGAEGEAASGRARDTIMRGYELKVSTVEGDRETGSTRLRLQPGTVPPLRMRATPVMARAGEEVTLELIRGPGFQGELPEKLVFWAGQTRLEPAVDRKSRSARFKVPDGFSGWIEAGWSGARALVHVQPQASLLVQLQAERPQYGPGEVAQLSVRTEVDGKAGPAAVGLFGVDESLQQLVPLPGADDLGRIKPVVGVSVPAFGVLDGQALAMGRIRGAHAAAATILRVSGLPSEEVDEQRVHAQSESVFDVLSPMSEHFYAVLAELHGRVRAWEEKAPEGDRMTPEIMARLWGEALEACRGRGEDVGDAFGRPLRLSRLPADLLALTDPRAVVLDGTRLSEDVENWSAWVAKETP
jgi:hypothetical protein